jgi:hypothetical protein
VILVRKGANSPTRGRKLRSTRTKARTLVDRLRADNTDLKKKLAEALEQQAATSGVLQVISSSPGELEPVFETMLANAVRICGAKFESRRCVKAMRSGSSPPTGRRRLSWSSGGESRSYDRRRDTIWSV